MEAAFTTSHRGGAGTPLVCIHGFMDTWRTWELVLPALEREHEVLAPTLAGHAGGPPLSDPLSTHSLAEGVERAMDEAGFDSAHLVGNSLGGYVALQLAARGRARTVVALAPAGGWAEGDQSYKEVLALQATLYERTKQAAPHADAIVSTADGRRRATQYITVDYEHIPPELLSHQLLGVARCAGARALIDRANEQGWPLDAEQIACPVRIVWGTDDALLKWPAAAARYRDEWLPQADWVELDGVGHCPQLDVPLEAAQLILGFTRA
jgi:pimeloyl-ACP methyl ester carboxylesterase